MFVEWLQHATTISNDFYIGGMEAAILAGCKLSRKLITTLRINSLPSDQLMLLYYKSLLNSSVCMLSCFLFSLRGVNFNVNTLCLIVLPVLVKQVLLFIGVK